MNHSKRPWIYGGIILVLLILFFSFINPFASNDKENSNTHNQHNSSEEKKDTSKQDTTSKDNTDSKNTSDSVKQSLSAYLEEQDKIMSDMMHDMNIAPSGNASLDFLKGMIPHHQSAIDMANSFLINGGVHSDLEPLAKNIVATQTEEITQMKELIEQIEASGETNEDMERGYLDAYKDMMSAHQHMSHGTSDAANVEDAFAEGMIMHHQMAVEMAKAILNYTDVEEVRTLAENMIEMQEQEITTMQKALGK